MVDINLRTEHLGKVGLVIDEGRFKRYSLNSLATSISLTKLLSRYIEALASFSSGGCPPLTLRVIVIFGFFLGQWSKKQSQLLKVGGIGI